MVMNVKTLGRWVAGGVGAMVTTMVLMGGAGCAGGSAAPRSEPRAQAPEKIQAQAEPVKRCDPHNPNRYYVSRDPDACARIRFACPNPSDPTPPAKPNFFGDDCGCGCER